MKKLVKLIYDCKMCMSFCSAELNLIHMHKQFEGGGDFKFLNDGFRAYNNMRVYDLRS